MKVAYLDDITLIGDAQCVAADFQLLKISAALIGLSCNTSKCEITHLGHPSSAEDLSSLFPHVTEVRLEDITLLGAALGESSLTSTLESHVQQIMRFTSQPSHLQAHDVFIY